MRRWVSTMESSEFPFSVEVAGYWVNSLEDTIRSIAFHGCMSCPAENKHMYHLSNDHMVKEHINKILNIKVRLLNYDRL